MAGLPLECTLSKSATSAAAARTSSLMVSTVCQGHTVKENGTLYALELEVQPTNRSWQGKRELSLDLHVESFNYI